MPFVILGASTPATPTEIFADPPVPGGTSPWSLGTLTVPITTSPPPGTVETYAVSAAAPAALRSAPGQFRVIVDNEEMVVAASVTGASPWTFTRGVGPNGSSAHSNGAAIYHVLTAGALTNLAANAVTTATATISSASASNSVAAYRAAGDGGTAADGAMSSSTSPTTLATAAPLKVNMTVYVAGAGAAGAMLTTTVAAVVDSTHVTLATAASTTVTAANIVYGTNDVAAFQAAATAHEVVIVPQPAGAFYLVDVGPTSANTLATGPSGYVKFIGASRDSTTVRLGPEGSTSGLILANLSSGQITFQDICLQGPDNMGSGGSTVGVQAGSAGTLRFINCWVRRFSTDTQVNASPSVAGIDADFTWFEGYGSVYPSTCVGAFDLSNQAYSPTKRIRMNNCRFSNFGDPAGGVLYHAIYVYTNFDLDVEDCFFHSPASSTTGNVVQHYDSSVTQANAAPLSRINAYFASDIASAPCILTSYNSTTMVEACQFANLSKNAVSIAGPAEINGCTFSASSTIATAMVQTIVPGQNTGQTWGLTMTGCRFRASGSTGGYAAVKLANMSATSDFQISDCSFDGATGTQGTYIMLFGSLGGKTAIKDCGFAGAPSNAIANLSANTGVLTVQDNRFAHTSGKAVSNQAALSTLNLVGNDFSNTGDAAIGLTTPPTLVDSRGNYGSNWSARTSVSGNYPMTQLDELVAVTSTSAAYTVTLPSVASIPSGKVLVVKDESGGAATHAITVAGTVDGATNPTIASNYGLLRVYSNGTTYSSGAVVGGGTGTLIITGVGPPTVGVGGLGDYYLDTSAQTLWGPKYLASGTIPAFPATPVFDTAARANESPLSNSGSWSGPILPTDVPLSLTSNAIVTTGGASSSSYWTPSSAYTDSEIYATIGPGFVDGTTNPIYLFWRVTNPGGASLDCYYTKIQYSNYYPHKITNGGGVGLSNVDTVTLSVGDSVGVRHLGTTITCMHKTVAGAWTTVQTSTDASWTTGSVGIGLGPGSGTQLTNIGGGQIVSGTLLAWPTAPALATGGAAVYVQDTAPAPSAGSGEYVWLEMDGAGNLLDILSGKA